MRCRRNFISTFYYCCIRIKHAFGFLFGRTEPLFSFYDLRCHTKTTIHVSVSINIPTDEYYINKDVTLNDIYNKCLFTIVNGIFITHNSSP